MHMNWPRFSEFFSGYLEQERYDRPFATSAYERNVA